MQNYSQIYADTLAEFVSPLVPADRGDEGKGQVNARAVYKIHTTMNANVGHIAKSGGQTQYHGLSVDAALDKSDGTGADYLTDVDLGNGQREIRIAYTPYAPPPPGTPMPPSNWVQPTAEQLAYGGPLVLKADSGNGGGGGDVQPPANNTEVLNAIEALRDEMQAGFLSLSDQITSATASIITNDNANTEKIQTQIHDVIEDAEAWLAKFGKLALLLRRLGGGSKSARGADDVDAAITDLEAALAARHKEG